MVTFELRHAQFCRNKRFSKKKVVTFELHMLTFELRWPPFCRKKRFFATKILQNFTLSYPKNLRNMNMSNSHLHDFEAFFCLVSPHIFFLLFFLLFFSLCLPASASLT